MSTTSPRWVTSIFPSSTSTCAIARTEGMSTRKFSASRARAASDGQIVFEGPLCSSRWRIVSRIRGAAELTGRGCPPRGRSLHGVRHRPASADANQIGAHLSVRGRSPPSHALAYAQPISRPRGSGNPTLTSTHRVRCGWSATLRCMARARRHICRTTAPKPLCGLEERSAALLLHCRRGARLRRLDRGSENRARRTLHQAPAARFRSKHTPQPAVTDQSSRQEPGPDSGQHPYVPMETGLPCVPGPQR